MQSIITTTDLQRNIGEVSDNIDKSFYIVTNRGKGRMVVLPYFDGCDGVISEYMEDFDMYINKNELKKKYKESSDSGLSDLVI